MKLNGVDTTIDAAAVKTIEVLEDAAGTGANTVDLSAVDARRIHAAHEHAVRAAGGADTLTGTAAERPHRGRAARTTTMSGKDGDDTLVWNNGDGSDEMNGGDGIDTIENNGADTGAATADETYTVETARQRASCSSAPRTARSSSTSAAPRATSTTSRAATTSSPRSTRPSRSPASP